MIKTIVACIGLTLSLPLFAASISYNGYTLDEDANIVSGGGLQWLQWDETVGQTVHEALGNYGAGGWRLATNAEMAKLFNSFDFGMTFDADENTYQSYLFSAGENSFDAPNEFIDLFGDTFLASGSVYDSVDPRQYASAYFGEDGDGDHQFNFASVQDEYTTIGGALVQSHARLYRDDFTVNAAGFANGVALVRAVPVPAAGWLLLSALMGLVIKKRV